MALDVKTGDQILFGKYSGSDTKLDGTEYIIMREDDVLGILNWLPGREERTANSIRRIKDTIYGKADYL